MLVNIVSKKAIIFLQSAVSAPVPTSSRYLHVNDLPELLYGSAVLLSQPSSNLYLAAPAEWRLNGMC